MDIATIVNALLTHALSLFIVCWSIGNIVKKVLKHRLAMKEEETKQLAIQHGMNPYVEDEDEDEESVQTPTYYEQPISYPGGYSGPKE